MAIEKLIKILELERQQGYENRAVIGGLEAFVPQWLDEAAGEAPKSLLRLVERLRDYPDLSSAERRLRVGDVLREAPEAGAPVPARASGGAPGRRDAETKPKVQSGSVAVGAGGSPRAAARTEDAPELDRPVVHLRGVGSKSADSLERLGITTIRDLLFHPPARYNDYSQLQTISRLKPAVDATIVGTVWDVRHRRVKGGRSVLTVILSDTTATIACSFFNQPYLEREFRQGRRIVVSGRVETWAGRLVFRSPEWEPVERDLVHTGRLVPVYPLTRGITQRWLRRQMKNAVDRWADQIGDPLPDRIRAGLGLLTAPEAVRELHFPADRDRLEAARRRLAFDELLTLQLWARRRRRERQARTAPDLRSGRPALDRFLTALPFEPTGAQRRVVDEIAADLDSTPMGRLLQGDVGSGKTAVAAASMVMAVEAGWQAALMAPTEILADQHAASLARLLEPHGYRRFDPDHPDPDHPDPDPDPDPGAGGAAHDKRPTLARLVGSMRPAHKAATVAALAEGTIDVLIGTHAVIQESVRFARLGLAVIDEQHRFGVLQRAELSVRSVDETSPDLAPHVLIMTATPIPRTLAQVLNADLEQSVIDELPPGRKPIRTRWLSERERERAYQFVRHRVAEGQQAYIVYSLVEESESIEARSAVAEHERLARDVFPDLAVGLIHGRLSAAEKEAAMAAFNAAEVDVLVATSVIEVGVDVPNATVMLIDGADRFGLAQLHQFRGRVGRGEADSVCLLIADDPSPTARERLKAMTDTTDGLVLAQIDLDMRGPGDYFGLRQSGLVDRFRFARLGSTAVLAEAQRAASEITQDDPMLERAEMAPLRVRVDAFSAAAERI